MPHPNETVIYEPGDILPGYLEYRIIDAIRDYAERYGWTAAQTIAAEALDEAKAIEGRQ